VRVCGRRQRDEHRGGGVVGGGVTKKATMLGCRTARIRLISLSMAAACSCASKLFSRTCLTAISSPVATFMPMKTFPNEPAPSNSPLLTGWMVVAVIAATAGVVVVFCVS
jgi:hypothetical protein